MVVLFGKHAGNHADISAGICLTNSADGFSPVNREVRLKRVDESAVELVARADSTAVRIARYTLGEWTAYNALFRRCWISVVCHL